MHDRAHDITARAREYVGTRYREKGRSIESGVDCAGLVICVARDLGLAEFDTKQYSRRPDVVEFDRNMRLGGCQLLPYADRATGDILRLREKRWPVHCAIYEVDERGEEWIIHAYLPYRKVAREPFTKEVAGRVSSVWRYPG